LEPTFDEVQPGSDFAMFCAEASNSHATHLTKKQVRANSHDDCASRISV
jgi:hypothetical protein